MPSLAVPPWITVHGIFTTGKIASKKAKFDSFHQIYFLQ